MTFNYVVSERCIDKLKNLEGFRMMPYKDTGGLFTVGYGQRCDPKDYPKGVTKEQADRLLREYLRVILQWLSGYMQGMTQNQVDALCLLIFNLGIDQFRKSSMYDFLKAHDYKAFLFWRQYVHDQHKSEQPGLVTRREFEIRLYIWNVW